MHASANAANSSGGGGGGIVYDLPLDSPPVLFIRKYGRTIDTQDLVLRAASRREEPRDQLTDMEKDATLTHTKIRLIQEAVRRNPTFEKLAQSFVVQRRPEPLLAPPVSEGGTAALKPSVFTDSDFENIR